MKQLFSIVTAVAMIFLSTSCSSYWLRKIEKNAAGKPYDHRKMECLKTTLYTSNIPMTTEKAIIIFEIKNTCVTSQTIVLQQTPFKTSYFPFTSDQLFEVKDGHGKTVDYKGVYARARNASWLYGDYFELPSGRVIHSAFNLAQGYTLTPGKIKIRYIGPVSSNLFKSDWLEFEIPTNIPVTME